MSLSINHKPLLITATDFDFSITDDCACPDIPFTLESYPNKSDNYHLADNFYQKISDQFHLLFSPFATLAPSIINTPALLRYQQFKTSQPLQQEIDYQLQQQNLLVATDQEIIFQSKPSTQLSIWLHVTNACNLDCPYCYVRKSSASMNEVIGKQTLDKLFSIAKNEGFKSLKIKYAGGEATLHIERIKTLHTYAKQLAKNNNIDLNEVILSNGTLITKELAEWLNEEKIKLMISLDGVGKAHDLQRYTKQKQVTFDIIEKNISTNLLPIGIKPDICVTVTQANANNIAPLMKWILERDLPFTLNFYRENKLSATYEELKLEEVTIIEGMLAAYHVIEKNLPQRPLLNSLLDKVQTAAHTHTCGVNKNYLVVTHESKVSQCQMHLDQPINATLNDSVFSQLQIAPIKNISVDEKEGCKECNFRYRCTGGCPLETYRATGRWDVKSPHCNIYQSLYPEILRLEGLRLLKYHLPKMN